MWISDLASFGFSISDFISLGQIAWKVVQNAKPACGEHAELTRETTRLHVVLGRLEREAAQPESLINQADNI